MVTRGSEPVDPAVDQIKRLVDVLQEALNPDSDSFKSFLEALQERGVRLREEPSVESIGQSIIDSPVAFVDATFRLLQEGLGRTGAAGMLMTVTRYEGSLTATVQAPKQGALGLAFYGTSDKSSRKPPPGTHLPDLRLRVISWPGEEPATDIEIDAGVTTIYAFNNRRITGVGIVPPPTDKAAAA